MLRQAEHAMKMPNETVEKAYFREPFLPRG
jgi:hypothetical protein